MQIFETESVPILRLNGIACISRGREHHQQLGSLAINFHSPREVLISRFSQQINHTRWRELKWDHTMAQISRLSQLNGASSSSQRVRLRKHKAKWLFPFSWDCRRRDWQAQKVHLRTSWLIDSAPPTTTTTTKMLGHNKLACLVTNYSSIRAPIWPISIEPSMKLFTIPLFDFLELARSISCSNLGKQVGSCLHNSCANWPLVNIWVNACGLRIRWGQLNGHQKPILNRAANLPSWVAFLFLRLVTSIGGGGTFTASENVDRWQSVNFANWLSCGLWQAFGLCFRAHANLLLFLWLLWNWICNLFHAAHETILFSCAFTAVQLNQIWFTLSGQK